MPRRLCFFAFAVLTLAPACREQRPWSQAGWRPATPPQRIVAGSIFAAEVLLAIAPRERIAAVHELAADAAYSLVAAEASGLALVGAEAERLLQVRPDLVVTDAFTRAETQALLDAAGVPIVRMAGASTFEDVADNVRHLGRIAYLEPEAEQLVTDMFARLRVLEIGREELHGWRLCNVDGALHSHGRGSLFDAVLQSAGARNLAAEHDVPGFRRLDVEEVLGWNPAALVLAAVPGSEAREREWLHQHPGLRLLPCVQKDRLLFVPPALLGTTSHHLVDTVAFVQKALRAWGKP